MPLVMVDTNIALRATLPEPGGIPRKLWVLFAYGAAALRLEALTSDLEALVSEQSRSGGEIHEADALLGHARHEVARFEELLPVGTPDDLVLAGSAACWDEYERKAREVAARFDRKVDAKIANALRRRYQSVCTTAPTPAYATDVPPLTSDPDDDLLVFDALRVDADIFISQDTDVVPEADDGSRDYGHGDKRLTAMRLEKFIEVCCSSVDWDQIDGSWV